MENDPPVGLASPAGTFERCTTCAGATSERRRTKMIASAQRRNGIADFGWRIGVSSGKRFVERVLHVIHFVSNGELGRAS